jgi:3-deoxy-D-manno-octulosonate 8-phosphate phosphatase (KDO 8-P phosphatase)
MNTAQYQIDQAWFKEMLGNKDLVAKLKRIKLVISDVDGALTDCFIYPIPSGEEIKGYSVQDGFGIAHAIKKGLNIGIMTGKKSPLIEKRAQLLGIPDHFIAQGLAEDKIQALETLKASHNLHKEDILFFGDDVLDGYTASHVSIFAVPTNAVFYIQNLAAITVPKSGRDGAFRLLVDLVLYVQGRHFAQDLLDKALLGA